MDYSDNMNPLYLILPEGKPEQGYCGEICHSGDLPVWDKTTCLSGCVDDKQCKEFKRKRKTSCRVVAFVGVVLPKSGHSGNHFYDLCQGEDCVKAGDISVFGGDDPQDKYVTLQGGVNDDDFYLHRSTAGGRAGVTDLMIEQGWSFKKPLVAKMTGSDMSGGGSTVKEKYWYLNLPEPVVILEWKVGRNLDRDVLKRQFILSPKEKRRNYGNLLDKYPDF